MLRRSFDCWVEVLCSGFSQMSATEGGGLGAVQHLGSIEGGMEGAMHLMDVEHDCNEVDKWLMIDV